MLIGMPSDDLELSIRSVHLLTYAEHLHSDPSLWELTLEYTAACGMEGKDALAELVMRVPIDFESVRAPKGKSKGTAPAVDVADAPQESEEAQQWDRWTAKMEKLITVCKDYGLDDVICSICKVSFDLPFVLASFHLIRVGSPLHACYQVVATMA
jgi:nuclear pore complex protein Nup85